MIEAPDEGAGLPPAAMEHIFERFARADGARSRREGGAGLGLAIVDAIARAHGGSVTARRGAERGTVFELRLPLPQAQDAEEREAPAYGLTEPAASIGA